MLCDVKNPVIILVTSLILVLAQTTLRAAANGVLWVDDALPAGAIPGTDGNDAWTWVSSNPTPFSGAAANQSSIDAGLHQHFFDSATATLTINTGDVLFAYIYLDPAHPPTEAMLQWNDGSWDHRAFWGANNITYGTLGTVSRFYTGPLPAAGAWVRLEVPARQVGLEGSTLKGLSFTLFDGRATWDAAGKTNGSGVIPPPSDTNAPVVTVTAPADNTIVAGSNVMVTAT